MSNYRKIAQLKTPVALRERLQALGLELPVDDSILTEAEGSPLAGPLKIGDFTCGNRWCIHPMEGWDANTDGSPSMHTLRRWTNFGLSGAKLIWGGEAAAVQPDGRANPNQTLATPGNLDGLKELLRVCHRGHADRHGGGYDDFLVGLQLTHSGRFSRPHSKKLEPRIAYRHPLLDQKFHIHPDDAAAVWSDEDLHQLVENYVIAAGVAREAGFQFVDVKACHGYLLHEFLSARTRPGEFGGDFAGRTRLLRRIIRRIQSEYPDLMVVVRLSAYDSTPFEPGPEAGVPTDFSHLLPYQHGFGVDPNNPLAIDLTEPIELLKMLEELGVVAVNITCGSPYYNPHIQRPAIFPPSDGYQPPEDPLVGVVRQIQAVRTLKQAVPNLPLVGTGYSYLQDYVPHVAQAVVRAGWVDSVGLGRMVLSYPQLPFETLQQGVTTRKLVCRTFSDCTTAPRNGLVSGCYPLDRYYKDLPEAKQLAEAKRSAES